MMLYDIVVDMIKHFSISLDFLKPYATLLGVIVLLLRQNNIKKIINGRLPKKYRDTQSSDIYDMMRDIRDIKAHLGVAARTEPLPSTAYRYPRFLQWMKFKRRKKMSRKLVMMLFGAIVMVLSQFGITLDPETIIGMGTLIISAILGQAVVDTNGVGQYAPLKEKFKSKKLWTALGGSVLIVLNDYYALGVSTEVIYWIVGLGVTFILGKSAVSVVQASKNGIIKDAPEPKIEEPDSQNYSH